LKAPTSTSAKERGEKKKKVSLIFPPGKKGGGEGNGVGKTKLNKRRPCSRRFRGRKKARSVNLDKKKKMHGYGRAEIFFPHLKKGEGRRSGAVVP